MRAATVAVLGVCALAIFKVEIKHQVLDGDLAIPRYILGKDGWVCVDRNPRQVNRLDCVPRPKRLR